MTGIMTGIDTNVLVRFIARDDSLQTSLATAFMNTLTAESPGFISLVVLAELYWVLSHSYKASRIDITRTVETLLFSSELVIEEERLVQEALVMYQNSNADFDDCLILKCAFKSGCQQVVTFDRKAARGIGLRLLS